MEDMDIVELDLKHLIEILLARMKFITIITLIFGLLAFLYTYFFITPMYTSNISMYVNNAKSVHEDKINSSDLDASKKLVNTYVAIIKSNSVLGKVADATDLDYTADEIREMMSAEAIANTEIFKVSIKNSDPEHAAKIANTIADVTPDEIANYVEASSVKVIDYAIIASKPFSPNLKMNVIIGILLGLMLSIAFVFIREMFDVRIKTEEDLERLFDLPVLGAIPNMNESNKKASYSYSSYNSNRRV